MHTAPGARFQNDPAGGGAELRDPIAEQPGVPANELGVTGEKKPAR